MKQQPREKSVERVEFLPAEVVRFWEKVRKEKSCWVWTGASARMGYGVFALSKTRGRPHKLLPAHRASFYLHVGGIPSGLCVLHRCDNPPCVRPDHLWLGTRRQNTQDMIAKGRRRVFTQYGSRNPRAKMNEATACEIHRRLKQGKTSTAVMGELGVTRAQVEEIQRGRRWQVAISSMFASTP